jgi:hypothetical protein
MESNPLNNAKARTSSALNPWKKVRAAPIRSGTSAAVETMTLSAPWELEAAALALSLGDSRASRRRDGVGIPSHLTLLLRLL